MSHAMIDTAAEATDTILKAVYDTADRLRRFEGRRVNGYGILADPSLDIDALLGAADRLQQAVAVARATNWPTNADYDVAEEGDADDWEFA